MEASGRVVEFLPEAPADAFCLRGGSIDIVAQLLELRGSVPSPFDSVVLHPTPMFPDDPECGDRARVAREILPRVRTNLTPHRVVSAATLGCYLADICRATPHTREFQAVEEGPQAVVLRVVPTAQFGPASAAVHPCPTRGPARPRGHRPHRGRRIESRSSRRASV